MAGEKYDARSNAAEPCVVGGGYESEKLAESSKSKMNIKRITLIDNIHCLGHEPEVLDGKTC